jgi:hypothetical protein
VAVVREYIFHHEMLARMWKNAGMNVSKPPRRSCSRAQEKGGLSHLNPCILDLVSRHWQGGKSTYCVGHHMLYLCVFTFDSSKRRALIKRRALGGDKVPESVKVLMEVVDLTKNRAFRLSEAPDLEAIEEANSAWKDLGHIETIPVVESEEILKKLIRLKHTET